MYSLVIIDFWKKKKKQEYSKLSDLIILSKMDIIKNNNKSVYETYLNFFIKINF